MSVYATKQHKHRACDASVPFIIDPTQVPVVSVVKSESSAYMSRDHCAMDISGKPPVVGSHIVAKRPAVDAMSDISHSQMSERGARLIVRECTKSHVFPHVKFYDKDEHHLYSLRQDTVCGIVAHHVGMAQTPHLAREWWNRTRGLVHSTHTMHRNNCIKALHGRIVSK
ncbi:MAG: hypothetical protein ACRC1D_01100 [Culicoidibacterales bacterium]